MATPTPLPPPARVAAELVEAPHGRCLRAEQRWRRCVDDLCVNRIIASAYRSRVDRVLCAPYLRAKLRLWEIGRPGGEAERARDAVHAAYGGQAPLGVRRRLDEYVLERLGGGLPGALGLADDIP